MVEYLTKHLQPKQKPREKDNRRIKPTVYGEVLTKDEIVFRLEEEEEEKNKKAAEKAARKEARAEAAAERAATKTRRAAVRAEKAQERAAEKEKKAAEKEKKAAEKKKKAAERGKKAAVRGKKKGSKKPQQVQPGKKIALEFPANNMVLNFNEELELHSDNEEELELHSDKGEEICKPNIISDITPHSHHTPQFIKRHHHVTTNPLECLHNPYQTTSSPPNESKVVHKTRAYPHIY